MGTAAERFDLVEDASSVDICIEVVPGEVADLYTVAVGRGVDKLSVANVDAHVGDGGTHLPVVKKN